MDVLEFNVSTLLRLDVGTRHDFTFSSDEPLDLDESVANRFSGAVGLLRTNFGILARAQVDARVQLTCGRCLEPYSTTVSASFEEEYLPMVDVLTGLPVQSERTDETFYIMRDHVVDLTEAVRQHLLLALPMHVVCSEDCRGLCVRCGQNLNTGLCTCPQDDDSHPLSVLATLLGDSRTDQG